MRPSLGFASPSPVEHSPPVPVAPGTRRAETVAVLLPFAVTLALVAALGVPVLFADEWTGVGSFLVAAHTQGLSASLLWAQHNEHRLFLPKLLFYAFHQNGMHFIPIMILSVLIMGISFKLLLPLLRPSASSLRRLSPWQLLGLGALFFSFVQRENLFWSFQLAWAIEICGFLLVLRSLAAPDRPGHVRAALGLGLAYLSSAHWIALVPLILIADAAWVFAARFTPEFRGRVIAAVLRAAVLVALIALYLRGWSSPTHHPVLSGALLHPLRTLLYFVTLLGNPFFLHCAHPSGFIIPVIGALYLGLFIKLMQMRAVRLFDRAFFVIAGPCVLVGMLAIGRSGLGWETALYSRYSACSVFGWVVLLGTAARALAGGGARPALQLVRALLLLGAVASAAGLVAEVKDQRPLLLASQRCVEVAARGEPGFTDPRCLAPGFPSVDERLEIIRALHALGLL